MTDRGEPDTVARRRSSRRVRPRVSWYAVCHRSVVVPEARGETEIGAGSESCRSGETLMTRRAGASVQHVPARMNIDTGGGARPRRRTRRRRWTVAWCSRCSPRCYRDRSGLSRYCLQEQVNTPFSFSVRTLFKRLNGTFLKKSFYTKVVLKNHINLFFLKNS